MKNTIKTMALLQVCKGLLSYTVTQMDEGREKELGEQLLLNLALRIEEIKISPFVMGGVFKAHKRLTDYLEGRIRTGDKYLGMMLACEILGAWSTEEPYLMAWYKDFDYGEVLDMTDTNDPKLVNRMIDISGGAVAKLKGWK